MFLGDLIAVLEAIDLLETLKACACLPGFTGASRCNLLKGSGTYDLRYVDNSANSLRNCG